MKLRLLLFAGSLLAAPISPAHAQDPRIAQRLGAAAADSIARIVTAAEAEGLPSAPLTAKALQGAARGAPSPLVLRAVSNLAAALRTARSAMGPGRSADELTAGAVALQNGADPGQLTRLIRAAGAHTVTMPLVVLTDLLGRGVPGDTLVTMLATVTRRGVSDEDLLRLRETISRDIAAGTRPLEAASARMAAVVPAPPPASHLAPPREGPTP